MLSSNFAQTQLDVVFQLATSLQDIDTNLIQVEFDQEFDSNLKDSEIQDLILKVLTQNIAFEFNFSYLAAKYLLHNLKQQTSDFPSSIKRGILLERLNPEVIAKFDLDELNQYLKPERDELLDYQGAHYFVKRYALTDPKTGEVLENPQYFFMRVAMGWAYNETDPMHWAKEFYDQISQLNFMPAGQNLRYSASMNPQMSNCFLLQCEDTMEDIYHQDFNLAMLAKFGGGTGISLTKLRAKGSLVKANGAPSCGAVEWGQHWDHSLGKVARGHKRKTAANVYMEPWHMDFPDFMRAKQPNIASSIKYENFHTVAWVNDELMRRVEAGLNWYMLDPKDFPELTELYGQEFDTRYNQIVDQIESEDKVGFEFKSILARDLWQQIMVNLKETGHPWVTFKDTANVRSQMPNSGVIHNSNLCTEITLPNSKDEIAVCILASVNLPAHLRPEYKNHKSKILNSLASLTDFKNARIDWNQVIDFDKLRNTVAVAVRGLDNVVDNNFYPVEEARRSSMSNRSIGVGVMGLSDIFCSLDLPFDSFGAENVWENLIGAISYYSYEASADLAVEKGSYSKHQGSLWSQGILPVDTYKPRAESVKEFDPNNLAFAPDWDGLRQKVRSGIRNSVLTAVAPSEHIARLCGVSNQIEPIFANIYSHKGGMGKVLNVNKHFVQKMKDYGYWEMYKDEIIEAFGDVEQLFFLPSEIAAVYRSAFQIPVEAQIEIAAIGQKYMDQALSRNLYHCAETMDEVMNLYLHAWKRGLKTTYYAVFKPTASLISKYTVEKSTATPLVSDEIIARTNTIQITKHVLNPVSTGTQEIVDSNLTDEAAKAKNLKEYEEKLICSLENKDDCEACQ